MAMANEIELKLKVLEKGDILDKLIGIFPGIDFELKELINVYYDTSDFLLNQKRIALRIRQKDGKHIQTLKTKGQSVNGLHQRGEWEWDLSSNALDEGRLNDCEAWPGDVNVSSLHPVFETNFSRYQSVFDRDGSKIELAFDAGHVLSNGKSEVINEIEIELLSGDANTLIELGKLVQGSISVQKYDVSKAERGYRLYSKTS